jgi:hypothetical protein
MEEDGKLIRLFPVPFRLVDDEKQFKKWQWIKARVEKASKDHRPESHKVFVDTIVCEGEPRGGLAPSFPFSRSRAFSAASRSSARRASALVKASPVRNA